jgi:hypothetical protein
MRKRKESRALLPPWQSAHFFKLVNNKVPTNVVKQNIKKSMLSYEISVAVLLALSYSGATNPL